MAEESHNGEGSRLKARCAGSWSQRYARLPESCAPPSAGCPVLQDCVADAFSLLVCATAAKSISGCAGESIPPAGRYAILGQLVVPPPAAHILSPSVPQLVTGSALATSPLLPYWGPPTPGSPRFHRFCPLHSPGDHRSGRALRFQIPPQLPFSPLSRSALLLPPFAPPALPRFLATTASADFFSALTEKISPGKVHILSPRAVRIYRMRLG